MKRNRCTWVSWCSQENEGETWVDTEVREEFDETSKIERWGNEDKVIDKAKWNLESGKTTYMLV